LGRKKSSWISQVKFFIGFLFIILNFILGKIALPVMAIETDLSLFIYAISWVLLVVGVAMCGKEGWYMAKRLYKKHENRIIDSLKRLKS